MKPSLIALYIGTAFATGIVAASLFSDYTAWKRRDAFENSFERYPYVVSVESPTRKCTGFLIAPDTVMTVANAFFENDPNGTHQFLDTIRVFTRYGENIEIVNIAWIPPSRFDSSEDYALLTLRRASSCPPVKVIDVGGVPIGTAAICLTAFGEKNQTMLSSKNANELRFSGLRGCLGDAGSPFVIEGKSAAEDAVIAMGRGSANTGCEFRSESNSTSAIPVSSAITDVRINGTIVRYDHGVPGMRSGFGPAYFVRRERAGSGRCPEGSVADSTFDGHPRCRVVNFDEFADETCCFYVRRRGGAGGDCPSGTTDVFPENDDSVRDLCRIETT